MADPTIDAEAQLQAILAFEAEADQTFGEDSRALRQIIGVAIHELRERAGSEATRAYLARCLDFIRRIDLLDVPGPDAPKAS